MTGDRAGLERRVRRILERAEGNQGKVDLRLLLENIRAYLLRGDETQSTKTVRNLKPYPAFHGSGDPYSSARAREVETRLRLVDERQLTSAERITQVLLSGLRTPVRWEPSERQVSILRQLDSDPSIGLVALAKSVSSTPRTVKGELERLRWDFGFQVEAVINPWRFRLRHYGVWFRVESRAAYDEFSQWLLGEADSIWGGLHLVADVFDVNREEGYMTLVVPAEGRLGSNPRALFRRLEGEFLQAVEVHEVQGLLQRVSLTSYDYVSNRWKIDADLMTEGALQLVRRRGPVLSNSPGFQYNSEPIRFDRADWIIAVTHCGPQLTKSEQRLLLEHYGKPLGSKSIWAREARLRHAQAVFPVLAFSNVLFDSYLLCTIICSAEATATLVQIASQLPFSRIYPTDKGAIVIIGTPEGGPGLAKQWTRTLLRVQGIEKLAVLRTSHYAPASLPISWACHWNETSQQWTPEPQE